MSTPTEILRARSRSNNISGRGTTIIRSIDTTPAARTTSDLLTILFKGILAEATGHPLPRRSSKLQRLEKPFANNAPKGRFEKYST